MTEYICEPYNDTFRCFPKGQKQSSVAVNQPKSKLGTVAKIGGGVVLGAWGCSGDPAAYYPSVIVADASVPEDSSVTKSTDIGPKPDIDPIPGSQKVYCARVPSCEPLTQFSDRAVGG